MTIRQQISQVAADKNPVKVYQGTLAEDYDGIAEYVNVALSRSSTSAAYARIPIGATGSGQAAPAGSPVSVISQNGHVEVVSLGSRVNAGYVTPTNDEYDTEPTVSPSTFEASTMTDYTGNPSVSQSGLDGGWRKLVQSGGLYNSDFELAPPALNTDLDDTANTIPYWDTLYNNGNTVHLQIIESSVHALGKVLRCTLDGGRSDGDYTWISQVIPANSKTGTVATFRFGDTVASSYILDQVYDWLDAEGNWLQRDGGGAIIGAINGAAPNEIFDWEYQTNKPPAGAAFLRIWIGARATGADATTRFFDILNVGLTTTFSNIKIPDSDPNTNDNTSEIYEYSRSLRMTANSGGASGSQPTMVLDGSLNAIFLYSQSQSSGPVYEFTGYDLILPNSSSHGIEWNGELRLIRRADNQMSVNGDFVTTVGMLGTIVVAGYVSDSNAATVNGTVYNGSMAVDSSHGRWYFKYGSAWHWAVIDGGFEIPAWETVCPSCLKPLKPDDDLIGQGDRYTSDGSLHGLWKHFACAGRGMNREVADAYWEIGRADRESTEGRTATARAIRFLRKLNPKNVKAIGKSTPRHKQAI